MQRIIVIFLAILVSLPVVMKGRESRVVSAPAAFSVDSSRTVQVRISGDVRHSGVYQVNVNTLTMAVIEMAEPGRPVKRFISDACSKHTVVQGDHLRLAIRDDGTGSITCGSMLANDRILLGIALDINEMNAADFERLPGIGPVMAQRIVEFRQKNGGKMKFEDLQGVEGIGEKKLNALVKFF